MLKFIFTLVFTLSFGVCLAIEDSLKINKEDFKGFLSKNPRGGIYQYDALKTSLAIPLTTPITKEDLLNGGASFFEPIRLGKIEGYISTFNTTNTKNTLIFVVATRYVVTGSLMGEQLSFKDIKVSKFGGEGDIARLSKEISKAYLQEITSQATYASKKIALAVKIEFLLGDKIYVSNVLLGNAFTGITIHPEMTRDFNFGKGENIFPDEIQEELDTKWLDKSISNILALFNGCDGVTHTVKYQDTMTKIIEEYFLETANKKLKRDIILACNPSIPNLVALSTDAGLTDTSLLTLGQSIIIPITKKELEDRDANQKPSRLDEDLKEIIMVERVGRENSVYVNGIAANRATKAQVLDTLRREKPAIWHLANHSACGTIGYIITSDVGISDTEISTLPLNQPKPELTFLNSCQSGIGGVSSLASHFITAGSRNAIGALWSLDDQAARDFAPLFYNNYFANSTLSIQEILRMTQIQQRETYPAPTYWGAYIHLDPNYRKTSSIILGANEAKVVISMINNNYVATITIGGITQPIVITLGTIPDIDTDITYLNNCIEYNTYIKLEVTQKVWGAIDNVLRTYNVTKVYFSPAGHYENEIGKSVINIYVLPTRTFGYDYIFDDYTIITLY